jgi:ABC-2 type transport system permease protein
VLILYLLMSGLYTPVDSMPRWVQWLAEANPVKHFVQVARAILVKGAGPLEIARPVGILVLFAVGILSLALRQYRKTSV